MGAALCPPKNKSIGGSSWVGNENENPFEANMNKKDRLLLRETWTQLQKSEDPKEIVGLIFLEIVNDINTELKQVFGVERAPRAAMTKLPKFGGHIARVTELLDQLTTMLGYSENLAGAWQLVRKTGRSHVKQKFLDDNLNQLDKDKNYFELVLNLFADRLIPYLTGEKSTEKEESAEEKKKVRFATTYQPYQVNDVWRRFFNIMVAQMTDSFELERTKQRNAATQKTLAPHQHAENTERQKRRVQEKASEIEAAAVEAEPKKQEEMYEDPF